MQRAPARCILTLGSECCSFVTLFGGSQRKRHLSIIFLGWNRWSASTLPSSRWRVSDSARPSSCPNEIDRRQSAQARAPQAVATRADPDPDLPAPGSHSQRERKSLTDRIGLGLAAGPEPPVRRRLAVCKAQRLPLASTPSLGFAGRREPDLRCGIHPVPRSDRSCLNLQTFWYGAAAVDGTRSRACRRTCEPGSGVSLRPSPVP